MCVMWMEGWRKRLETKLGKIETMTMLLIFVRSIFITYIRKEPPVAGPVDIQKYARKLSLAGSMYNQQLFHKPNPKCHSPGIIYSRFECSVLCRSPVWPYR